VADDSSGADVGQRHEEPLQALDVFEDVLCLRVGPEAGDVCFGAVALVDEAEVRDECCRRGGGVACVQQLAHVGQGDHLVLVVTTGEVADGNVLQQLEAGALLKRQVEQRCLVMVTSFRELLQLGDNDLGVVVGVVGVHRDSSSLRGEFRASKGRDVLPRGSKG